MGKVPDPSPPSKWRECREWTRLVIEVATLIAVGWYACIAYRQWSEMTELNRLTNAALQETKRANAESGRLTQESVALTRKNMEVASRAWVTISDMKFEISIGSPLKFITAIENSGNSPAVIIDSWYGTDLVKAKEQPVLKWPKERRPEESLPHTPGWTVIGPKQKFLSDESGPVVTPTLAMAIKNKTEVLYRYGFIKYRDVFGVPRTTRYCFWFDGERQHSFACSEPGSNTFD